MVVRQIDTDGVRDSQAGELLGAGIVFLAGVVDDGFGERSAASAGTCAPSSPDGSPPGA